MHIMSVGALALILAFLGIGSGLVLCCALRLFARSFKSKES